MLRPHRHLPKNEFHLRFCYKTFLIDLDKTKEEIYADFDASRRKIQNKKSIKIWCSSQAGAVALKRN